jgi:CHAT domain-containing protein
MVSRYLAAIHGSKSEDASTASLLSQDLFDKLIAPVASYLGASRSLYIVPDKVLYHLPWDALSENGRFLVENYTVTIAPSATLFAVCTRLARQKSGVRAERVLSVGNPGFNHEDFPGLERLTDADREATEVGGMYDSRVELNGADARERIIRAELMKADVAHFALHCVVDRLSSAHSCLVLAKESASEGNQGADGALRSYEISSMRMPRARLVVLAACQSGVERFYRGEGMIGIARSFLVARVPVVVASIWPVNSEATTELMIRFHRYRVEKDRPTAEALRSAKLSMLGSETRRYSRPAAWAGFETIGGQAEF